MPLTLDQVRHIAALARLRLTAEEERRYAGQLSAILDYAERLQRVDTADVPPTAGVQDVRAPLRPDHPRPGLPRERALANAPATADGMFLVPPVLDV
ncbi:MAG TPA: Asp-tRNA(Asn)/Glu-tRNA(Gln) amidotransferase subunit GatC [Anaerolineales bacterium]|nr:Asp-tRNA(Asn)/Glu-tRNA(Gln) amidotransferase subunit GatC [Anaerolineales bacterium]